MKFSTVRSFPPLLLLGFSLILLAPLLVLAFYNVPSSDDFSYGRWQRDWGTIGANLTCYFGWGGRYFSNLLLTAANPLGYSMDYRNFLIPYQLHSVVLMVFLVISFFHLTQRIFPREGRKVLFPFSTFILSLTLFFLKDLNELFYWMAGSYNYCYGLTFALMGIYFISEEGNKPSDFEMFRKGKWKVWLGGIGLILILILTSVLFRKSLIAFLNPRPALFLMAILGSSIGILVLPYYQKAEIRSTFLKYFLGVVCAFLAIGSNEMFAFIILPIYFVLEGYRVFQTRRITLIQIVLILTSLIAAGLNLFSPSTLRRREQQTAGGNPFDIFDPGDVKHLLNYFNYFTGFALLVFAVYLLFIKKREPLPSNPSSKSEGILFVFAWLCLGYLLIIVPLGLSFLSGFIPDRTKNPLAILAIFPLFIIIKVSSHWLPIVYPFRWGILAFGFFVCFAINQGSPLSKTWYETLSYITSPDAKKSIDLHRSRFQAILDCPDEICFISKNPFHSDSLFNGESATLVSDPESWKHFKKHSYAAFFRKKSIIAR